jgi:hypothetical protein
MIINAAREKGVSAYVGEGLNRWPAVHRLDAARLYRLALEKAAPGSILHAVAEESILFRDIAQAIGKGLQIPVVAKTPEEAAHHFGWFASLSAIDVPASSKLTQERLGWHPVHPSLLADLEKGTYFVNSNVNQESKSAEPRSVGAVSAGSDQSSTPPAAPAQQLSSAAHPAESSPATTVSKPI